MGSQGPSVLSEDDVTRITDRLSALPSLYMPHSVVACRGEGLSQEEKKNHLAALLRRDAAVFLERYGKDLRAPELGAFAAMDGDYEVQWHLSGLRRDGSDTAEATRAKAAIVNNRRLAHMSRLLQEGQFFNEESMRLRAPLLHQELIGQFEDSGDDSGGGARPGEKYSETLIRQSQEVEFQRRLRDERREAGLPDVEVRREEEKEEQVVEEEEEEEEEEDRRGGGGEEEMSDASRSHTSREEGVTRVARRGEGGEDGEVTQRRARQTWGGFEDRTGDAEGVRLDSRGEEDGMREGGVEGCKAGDGVGGGERGEGEKGVGRGEEGTDSGDVMRGRKDDFLRLMQERFLSGGEADVDYGGIDSNSALDDDWLAEVGRDAEERYFEED